MKNLEANSLLDSVYKTLGFSEVAGTSLFEAKPKPEGLSEDIWVEKGDWLALAHEAGAQKIFFQQNNPVVVFARLENRNLEENFKLYNRIWSMARPRFLFLAGPGELAVYDLAKKPPHTEEEFNKLAPLEIVRSATEIAEKLKTFRREELEAGRVFTAEYRFGDLKYRADKALINDLKEVRRELMKKGLSNQKLKFAHSLIGRSIFIRYLEDRKILTKKTFDSVAQKNKKWKRILESSPNRPGLDFTLDESLFLRVLEDKSFTFALFRKLGKDFNGDMFPDVDQEEAVIQPTHLKSIQDLLFGETGRQKSLFFYAYQFKIIPIDLISSIYEEFYHGEGDSGKKQGAFYTPPSLVEFVLSQILTPKRLATRPLVMDPACGSGIFLVESFRRMVRYRIAKQNRRLRFDELQKILRDQLRGIDVNPEAIRVAAFSLYLSLLHYLETSDIREQIEKGNRLPNLVVDNDNSDSFGTLLHANAFDEKSFESRALLKEHFFSSCADIVVGNPPWASPGPKAAKARKENKVAMGWCEARELPVGDKERSQAFIWRALDMLKQGGTAGLLVSTGVFFKHHENSVAFRKKWLGLCTLDSVYNFANTRHVFFKGADSPFAAVFFHKHKENISNHCVNYWTAKRTRFIEGLQSVVFSRNDIKILRPEDDLTNYQTWKIFWWGNHRDKGLISFLKNHKPLAHFIDKGKAGRGYEIGNKMYHSKWLKKYKTLAAKDFNRYGPLNYKNLKKAPEKVSRRGLHEIYYGTRLLIGRGINENSYPKGQIDSRFEEDEFCFTHAIYGVKLQFTEKWKFKLILGILWSTLARYYFFSTTANWGVWHDEIHLKDELLQLPICFPKTEALKNRIVKIVEELQTYDPLIEDLYNNTGITESEIRTKRQNLEKHLDQAIFKLYGLGEAEIDLVRDMCDINLDFFYLRDKSEAVKPVVKTNLEKNYGSPPKFPKSPIGDYIKVFIKGWSSYLDEGTKFYWQFYLPIESNSMVAVVFSVRDVSDEIIQGILNKQEGWTDVLRRLDKALLQPISSSVYTDGLVRAVTDDEIIVIKRNEKRLWTKSMAREDAEATIVQAMKREEIKTGRP